MILRWKMLVFVYCPCCDAKSRRGSTPKWHLSERDNQPWFADRMRAEAALKRSVSARRVSAMLTDPARESDGTTNHLWLRNISFSLPILWRDGRNACRVPSRRGPSVICDDRSAEVVDASAANRTNAPRLVKDHLYFDLDQRSRSLEVKIKITHKRSRSLAMIY